jgi:uncharacterized membrane protein
VLNTVTYADMAWRGRDASSTPERTVEALADAVGSEIPGNDRERSNRTTALGALLGTASGLAAGVLAAAARTAGLRFPAPLEAALTGAAAMTATDLPMALLGITDPRQWSRSDWISDAVPHLAYAAAAAATLRAMDADERPVQPASAGLIARSALLGIATGSRSSLGFAAPALTSRPTPAHPNGGAGLATRTLAGLGLATELVLDKLPATPRRTSAQGLPARFAAAASATTVLARREAANGAAGLIAGAIGVAAGSWGGLAWRRWAAARLPDWQSALIEDAMAVTIALAACRNRSEPTVAQS